MCQLVTGPPTHSVGSQISYALWRLSSSSVTLHGGLAGGFTGARQAMTSCRLQSNYSSTVTLHGGPVVLRPVRATPCIIKETWRWWWQRHRDRKTCRNVDHNTSRSQQDKQTTYNMIQFSMLNYLFQLPFIQRERFKQHVLTVRDDPSFAKRIVIVCNYLHDCIVLSKFVTTFRHTVNKFHFSDYCDNWILRRCAY